MINSEITEISIFDESSAVKRISQNFSAHSTSNKLINKIR